MIRLSLLILGVLTCCGEGSAYAQSMSPMRASVTTFGEMGAVRASLRNPYAEARRFEIEAFDLDWQPAQDVRLLRSSLTLGAGGKTSVLALLPVSEGGAREVYICATSSAYRVGSAGIRGQVCGRYRVVQRSL